MCTLLIMNIVVEDMMPGTIEATLGLGEDEAKENRGAPGCLSWLSV